MTETREWQQLEGEYEYPQVIGTKPTVCCDVPRQHMNDLGRSALPRKVDNDLFLIPCRTPGNTSAHSIEPALSSEWESQFYNLPKTPAQPNNFCSVEIL